MSNRYYAVEDHHPALDAGLSREHYAVWQRQTEVLSSCSVNQRSCFRCSRYRECVKAYDTLCSSDARAMAMKLMEAQRA